MLTIADIHVIIVLLVQGDLSGGCVISQFTQPCLGWAVQLIVVCYHNH